jgi:putative ABC transport system permease protein
LRIFMRNLLVYKNFNFINLIGLSVGITLCMLILVYIRFETSFDRFNPDASRIYRIVSKNTQDGTLSANTPVALSTVLKKDFPEIDGMASLMRISDDINVNDERFKEVDGAVVEKEFFTLFRLPLLSGSPSKIFQHPDEAVVTQKLAGRMFGDQNPLGKTFELDKHTFTVTGVVDNIPANSLFASLEFFLADGYRYQYYTDLDQRWYVFGLVSFVTFHNQIPPRDFESRLAGLENRYYPDFMKNRFTYQVLPFKGSHLNRYLENDLVASVAPAYLWILFLIAMGILLIACLNFMNISMANAGKRSLHTGIKKVTGASPGLVIREIFLEIALMVLLSLTISTIGVQLLIPAFNNMMGKNLQFDPSDPLYWLGLILIGLITVAGSGIYPAISFSRTSPLSILRQKRSQSSALFSFQRSFVVVQFTLTLVLVIFLLFTSKQVAFLKHHQTGFDRKNLISIPVMTLDENTRERLKKMTQFLQVLEPYQSQYGYGKASVTEFVPGFGFRNLFKIYPEDTDGEGLELLSCDVDENMPEVFGLHILEGRYFSEAHPTDADALVINEAAYRKLGWKSIEGKRVGLFSKDNQKEVIGVINDINVNSLKNPVMPMIYQFGPHHMFPRYITFRMNGNRQAALAFMRSQWTKLYPDIPFEFESVEDKFLAEYGDETRLSHIIGVFSVLAVMISLLGIMALSTLECERRTKEIGIRRVNGASVHEMLRMLNTRFLKLVTLAFLLAVPVSIMLVNKWLENFAYKTGVSWWVFIVAGLTALIISTATISWQTWRASRMDPVEALRYE